MHTPKWKSSNDANIVCLPVSNIARVLNQYFGFEAAMLYVALCSIMQLCINFLGNYIFQEIHF